MSDVQDFRERLRSRDRLIHNVCFYGGFVAFAATVLSGVLPLMLLSGVLFFVSGKKAYDGVDTGVSYRRGPSAREIEDMSAMQRRQHAERVGLRLMVLGIVVIVFGIATIIYASSEPEPPPAAQLVALCGRDEAARSAARACQTGSEGGPQWARVPLNFRVLASAFELQSAFAHAASAPPLVHPI